MKAILPQILFILWAIPLGANASPHPLIDPPAGRIALITDGNAHDPDDVIGTPVALALIKAAGLSKRVISVSHSSELTNKRIFKKPGGGKEQLLRQKFNQEACDEFQKKWGGYEHLTFWNCRKDDERAKVIAELRAGINASSKADPLWVIEAGEPDVLYDAAIGSDRSKLRHVWVITHHPNNDIGSDRSKGLANIIALEDPGVRKVSIPDQNKNLKTPLKDWEWAQVHPDPPLVWLYQKGVFAANSAYGDRTFKYKPIAGKFDCSDAGMALYFVTGATQGGLKEGTPADCQKILEWYLKKKAKVATPIEK